jgi:Tfp pilus assembly PilM family ATPase
MALFRESIWGIDLGATSLRVVRLGRRGPNFEITAVDRIDIYRDPQRSTPEDLDAALRKALSIFVIHHKVRKNDRVGVAIPGIGFETFILDLPPVSKKRIPELVDYEVRTRLGAAGSEALYGYCEVPGPSINEKRVLATAGSGGIVGAYLDALQLFQIPCDRLTVAPLAVLDALRFDGLDVRDAVIVRIGIGTTDMILGLRDGPLVRSDAEGTRWISRSLEERMGLSEREADHERRQLEQAMPDSRFLQIGEEYARRIVVKIQAAIEFARGRSTSFSPRRILVTGAGCRIPRLVDIVARTLDMPVEIHSMWNRVAIHKQLLGHALVAEVPTFSAALGAALDAAGSSNGTVSLVEPDTTRELARSIPAVFLSIGALWLGVATADLIVDQTSAMAREAEKLALQARAAVSASEALLQQAAAANERHDHAEKSWRLPAEWNAWEQALAWTLELLPSTARVQSADYKSTEESVRLVVELLVVDPPVAPDALPLPKTAWRDSLLAPFRAAGLQEPVVELVEELFTAATGEGNPARVAVRARLIAELAVSPDDTHRVGARRDGARSGESGERHK